jgi:protein involved in polysaccharide export with SLBB domain
LQGAAGKVFRTNVFTYASLAAAQPVRVFVGGFVHRPGLYSGTSLDSLLHFLDQAGGIDPDRGSFLDVQVKRGSVIRATVNLYEFLLDGRMPVIQLADGDVIFVTPRQNTVKVSGLAENAKRFEFRTIDGRTVADLIRVAKPLAQATHVRVVRNVGTIKDVEYYALKEAADVALQNGDELIFTADLRPGTITVRVEGEHESAQEYVLPYGSRVGDLIKQVHFTERSDSAHIQLFRLSVQERQKVALNQSLNKLEATILTARSGTDEEAKLRQDEAQLMLQWVERARKIEPLGQVVIAQAKERDSLLLENGDVFRVPANDGLVLVSGEVLFPNATTYDNGFNVEDYIKRAGGYTQTADTARILIARRDGSFDVAESETAIRSGDEILVLPKVESKPRQFWKDLVQIIFQLALSAKVVLN